MNQPAIDHPEPTGLARVWSKISSVFWKVFGFTRVDPWWWLLFAVIGLILIMVLGSPTPYWKMLQYIGDGIWVSIYITLISFFLVLIFGLVAALGRLSKIKLVRVISTVYVETIRGIPMLVQLFFWYFAFPSIIRDLGVTWQIEALAQYKANGIAMAILGLTFGYSAYMSEVYRAGIQAISRGQMEAARSLGMTYIQAMRHVILPQAVRMILPPVGNEFITLLKDSSLVSVVAIADMTRLTREFTAKYFIPVEGYALLALLYLVMTLFAARMVNWIERKTKIER